MKNTVTRRFATLALPALLLAAGAVHAQKAPIKFVVPYPAGGAADQITRLVASEAANVMGATIVIENKAGAAGMIAEPIQPGPSASSWGFPQAVPSTASSA